MRGATAARRSLQEDVGAASLAAKERQFCHLPPLTLIPLPSLGGEETLTDAALGFLSGACWRQKEACL